jgi:glycosyltransferase involved in cell wall biosynthesis
MPSQCSMASTVVAFRVAPLSPCILARLGIPFLTTLHGRLDLPGLETLINMFPEAPFVSISDSQRKPLPSAKWLGTVYHGLPPRLLTPSFEAGEYIAFLGRFSPEKGPEAAIRIASHAGVPLRLAAKVPRGDRKFYRERLEPLIDGSRIRLIGEVDEKNKARLIAGAAALIFPIDWPEPFGLVMIEAMACGTPVIAFKNGSVAEVIEEGVSGFIVEDEAAAVDALKRIGELDRRRVREAFELEEYSTGSCRPFSGSCSFE